MSQLLRKVIRQEHSASVCSETDSDSDTCVARLTAQQTMKLSIFIPDDSDDSDSQLLQHSLSMSSSSMGNSPGAEALSPAQSPDLSYDDFQSTFSPAFISDMKSLDLYTPAFGSYDVSLPPTPFPSAGSKNPKNNANRSDNYRYLKGRVLGSGTSGVVYECLDVVSGRFIACKEVMFTSKSSEASALKEVTMLSSIKHPNIVRCFGFKVHANKLMIFQELLNQTLKNVVVNFEQFPIGLVKNYGKQIAQALDYLHNEKKTVHRDVKLVNIFVSNDGIIKLGDFGSATLSKTLKTDNTSGLDTLIGTPCFMAPEVLLQKSYGRKADVFSFGAVLYGMANQGHPPWAEKLAQKSNLISFLYDIAHTVESPQMPKSFDTKLISLLERCFERDPVDRPSIRQILSDPFFDDV
ncbi:hypothetical protein GEMRC1_002496 [Eukaryota sp. GEM-RC1]